MNTKVVDLFDPEDMQNPHTIYDEMRQKCPVSHSDEHGGFWAITRYEDVKAVAQDFRTYSSSDTNSLVSHDLPRMIPIDMDPPEHRLYRKLLSPRLAADKVPAAEAVARAHAKNLVDQFKDSGTCDFVAQFAQPYPMAPIFSTIGIAQDAVLQIFGAADAAVKYRASDPEKAKQGAHDILAFATEIARQAQANPPENSMIGDLVHGDVRGEPLTEEEIARYILILLFGGLDTTTNTLVFTIHYLGNNPELREKVVSDLDNLSSYIDEFVRLASTVQGLTRRCRAESKIGEATIHEGDKVLMLFGAANRDPEVFENPHEFNKDRDPSLHVGFGAGAHICLGQHLARVLLTVGLQEFLGAIPNYDVSDSDKLQLKCSEVRGFESLVLSF